MKSILKAGIDKLPKTFNVKPEGIPNALKKMGVKDEEIEFSMIDYAKEGKVSKADLQASEAARRDQFGVEQGGGSYNWVSLKEGQQNPTYKENVYTFKNPEAPQQQDPWDISFALQSVYEGAFLDPVTEVAKYYPAEQAAKIVDEIERVDTVQNFELILDKWLPADMPMMRVEESRYTSSHFQDVPDYLMHTRTYDDNLNGQPTRVVQEIQSDLHQAGRQQGYANNFSVKEQRLIARYANDPGAETDEQFSLIIKAFEREGFDPWSKEEPIEAIEDVVKNFGTEGVPASPYKESWLRKGIEREVEAGIAAGKSQIAIPISGDVGELKRADGVQKWYETKVLSTAKKIAKQNDMDFEIVTVGKEEPADLFDLQETTLLRDLVAETDNPSQGVQYAVIKPKVAQVELPKALLDAVEEFVGPGKNTQASIDEFEKAGMPLTDLANIVRRVSNTTTNKLAGPEYRAEAGELIIAELQSIANAKGTKAVKPNFSLYSTPAVGAFAAYQAVKAEYSTEEVTAKLMEGGLDEGEAKLIESQARQAVEAGYTEEEIKSYLDTQEEQVKERTPTPSGPVELPPEDTTAGDAYRKLVGAEELSPKELDAAMRVVAPDVSFITTNLAGFFGNENAARISEEAAAASQAKIIAMFEARGHHVVVQEGRHFVQTEQGLVPVDAGILESLWASKGEAAGAISGAILGGRAGATAGLAAAPPFPLAKVAGLVLGGGLGVLTGGALGSIAGTELDYVHSAVMLQEDMNAEVAARKALTAAEASVVFDSLAFGAFKMAGGSWRAVVGAKDWIKKGYYDRAATALKENLFIDDEAAQELVRKLRKVADVPGKDLSEQKVAAVGATQPGAEGLVKASTSIDAQASAAVSKAIDDRAQDLLRATDDLTDENIGKILKGELEAYTTQVKEFYAAVKAAPSNSPRANNFKFNFDKLAIEPVLSRLNKNIQDPTVAFKFARQAEKIRDMSSTRSFSDLLELRQLVNDFKYNKRIRSTKDFAMLNDVLTKVDGAIEQGAYHIMENPQQWLGDFKTARAQYSTMKGLEQSQLIKIVNRPGVSEKVIGQALAKYAYSLDDTFVNAIKEMPKQTRGKVEGAVISNLSEKFTAGLEGGQRAVNFPMLAKELQGITFTSPDARVTKKAIIELAEVFKNDIPLAQSTGNIQIQHFQSFLTVDPVVRAQFELASSMFNWVKTMAPTKQARTMSLVKKTAKVLENPINSKSIKELTDELDGAVNISQELEQLVTEATKRKAKTGSTGMPRMKLYGDGKVLTTKGTGKEQSIPIHRVASIEQSKAIAEAKGINPADRKVLDDALREQGYMAVQLGSESIRRID